MAERGQPGNGIAKTVRTDDGPPRGKLTAIQAKRGHGLGGVPGDPWTVAVVRPDSHDLYTPTAAREFAQALLDAADECEQFYGEDMASLPAPSEDHPS